MGKGGSAVAADGRAVLPLAGVRDSVKKSKGLDGVAPIEFARALLVRRRCAIRSCRASTPAKKSGPSACNLTPALSPLSPSAKDALPALGVGEARAEDSVGETGTALLPVAAAPGLAAVQGAGEAALVAPAEGAGPSWRPRAKALRNSCRLSSATRVVGVLGASERA